MSSPLVGVIMGSDSDLSVMQAAVDALAEFEVPHEVRVVSAHRTPDVLYEYARAAAGRGLRAVIAGAGGAAHLPGMVAAMTPLPVIGVPVPLRHHDGLDSLLSIVEMPEGVPVATVGVGKARNAGLLAVRILGEWSGSSSVWPTPCARRTSASGSSSRADRIATPW
jgi:5-(carboxyamino)imidazole ribonucleotide mutase